MCAVSSGKTQEMAQVLQISPLKSPFVVKVEPQNFSRTAFLAQSVLARLKDFGFCQGCKEKSPGSGSEQMKLELLIHLTPKLGALKTRKPGPALKGLFILSLSSLLLLFRY